MIKQRKLKYKKNFNKTFHSNIHESAARRTQKKKRKKSANPFCQPVLETLIGIAIGTVFNEAQCFSRSMRPEMFLKQCKKFAKFTGVKLRCWCLFFIKLQAEDQ